MYRAYEIRRALLSLFLPNRCPFCDDVVGMTQYWCEDCYSKLPFMEETPQPPEHLDGLLTCCYYSGRARSAVLRMKDGFYAYAPEAFAVMMTELVGGLMPRVDIVTGIPSTTGRRFRLGYAQAEKIARDIAMRSGKSFRRLLKVSKGKKEQKRLNKAERLENARNSYKIADKEYISEKIILLVDDVTTTGATLSATAKLLKQAGARAVFAVTFAKTRQKQ